MDRDARSGRERAVRWCRDCSTEKAWLGPRIKRRRNALCLLPLTAMPTDDQLRTLTTEEFAVYHEMAVRAAG